MHRLLKRQLKRHFQETVPETFQPLLQAISSAYEQADLDREMLERSLALTAEELLERNQRLSQNLQTQQQAQADLKASYEILDATLNASKEGILVVSADTDRPIAVNKHYLLLMGLSEERINHMTGADLFRNSFLQLFEGQQLYDQLKEMRNHEHGSHRIYPMRKGGWLEVYAVKHPVAGYIWMLRDISEIREKEETITYQAQHDSLTGLPNRVLLQDRLELSINRAQAQHSRIALCYIDLDGFKTINDSLGHASGDKLLIEVALRLKQGIKPQDTLARVGGDEFVVIMDDISSQDEVLQRADNMLATLMPPVELDQRSFFIGASIGIAMYPNDGESTGLLMRNADIAMYRAKANGKNCFHFFTPSLERIAQHRLQMETELRKAIEQDQLELYYQPKVFLQNDPRGARTGQLHSFEALLRWQRPDGSFVSPESFIHIAEEAGMISQIGQMVVEKACNQARQWLNEGYESNISINLSPRQFLIPGFHEDIVDTIRSYGIPSAMISVEITESLLMQDLVSARGVLEYFRAHDVFVYLDDFGSGFSSLNYLKTLPVDAIKIDRTFVRDLSTSRADRAIANTIITLGKQLNKLIVAEGIETVEQANFLIDSGCDLAQGYFYGRPVNGESARHYFQLSPTLPAATSPLAKPGASE